MLLVTPPSHIPTPALGDPRREQREALRELLTLVAAASGLLVVAILLGRTPLGLITSPSHPSSWTDGKPGLGALRTLRVLLLVGSITLIGWLALLAVMCVPRRTVASTRLARLPFNRLVRQALIGTVTLGLVGSSAGAAIAASRPAVVADDATGGQRWPDLSQQPVAPTRAPHGITPSTQAEVAIVRTPTILPRLAVPTTSTPSPSTSEAASKPINTTPAGPSLPDVFDRAFPGSRSPTDTVIPQPTTHDATPTRIVRAGESFWSIAEDEVLTTIDEATDADVADYWRRLIERNRARLPDPTNPDLLWVGTALSLPPTDGPDAAPLPRTRSTEPRVRVTDVRRLFVVT